VRVVDQQAVHLARIGTRGGANTIRSDAAVAHFLLLVLHRENG
jgi:hypothetical protein